MKRDWRMNAGLLALRAILAVVFVYHGGQKLFGLFGGAGLEGFAGFLGQIGVPLPQVSAVLAALAEFGGGILLGLGVLARLATIPMAFTMLVAAFGVHGQAFGLQSGGMEYALTLAVVLGALGLMGPGAWTLPALLRAGPARDRADAEDDPHVYSISA
jgi:putative oxidoreductase